MNLVSFKITIFFVCLVVFSTHANNVTIANVSMTNDSTITFDISWENSWRVSVAPNNHDAVWVFIKKRDCASMVWSHVNLSPTVTSHSAASPLEVYIDGKDGSVAAKGVFLRRSSNGTGNISATTVSLRTQGYVAGLYDFQVFGIEMVQIPTGSFYAGDGTAYGTFHNGAGNPFLVTNESVSNSNLVSSVYTVLPLPVAFPKGFNEVYVMKYEISQGQYVDFVNTLNPGQASVRQITGVINGLNISSTWPSIVSATPHRAMNYLAWADLLAYLDWSALRPMTELEYEKICRGSVFPNSGEYAWGSNLVVDANTLVNGGTSSENVSTVIPAGYGIANYNLTNATFFSPLRCGFAAKPSSNRYQSGAGYFGVMELSGNVSEQVISLSAWAGVAFQGQLGDGEISVSPTPGYANVANWPSVQANGSATSVQGRSLRGGNWCSNSAALMVSDRSYAVDFTGQQLYMLGGRGVR